jgi:Cu/Ag efflux protein CusF
VLNYFNSGGENMKKSGLILVLVAVILSVVAGAAFAAEMSGTVSALDAKNQTLTIKDEKVEVGFDCEIGSLMKDVKVGDKVTVEYKEAGGKKKVTKVSPMVTKKKAAVGC